MSTPKDTRTALGDITNNHVTGMLQIFDMYTTVQSNTSGNMLLISYMYVWLLQTMPSVKGSKGTRREW